MVFHCTCFKCTTCDLAHFSGYKHVECELKDGVAVVRLNSPGAKVNTHNNMRMRYKLLTVHIVGECSFRGAFWRAHRGN